MNVSSSTATQLFQNTAISSKNSNLSTEQKDLIEKVLSNYDSESLSVDDASEIVQAFDDAGIGQSQALASAMEASGFDAQEVGNLAQASQASSSNGSRPMGPPPPPPEEEVDSVASLLESLLSTDEEDEEDTTLSTTTDSSSFDAILDYTTKIMSLKDDAKTEVMDLLEQYNSEDNELSQADTQKFIVNSLSQILGESDNYNTISFYA